MSGQDATRSELRSSGRPPSFLRTSIRARNSRTTTLAASICALAIASFASATNHQDSTSTGDTVEKKKDVSFKTDIEPIFSRHCYGCHQGAKQLGSYMMTDFASLVAGGETEQAAIVPGKPDESYLIEQITPVDGHAEMPDEPFKPLSEVEIDLIRRWIEEGAKNDSPEDSGPRYDSENPPVYAGAPAIPSIDVSPDGSLLAVAGFHEVLLLDAKTGEQKSRLVGMSPRINTVRFSPDGKRLAAVGGTLAVRGEVQIWEVDSGELGVVTTDHLRRAERCELVARRQQACLWGYRQCCPSDRRQQWRAGSVSRCSQRLGA